MPFSLDYAIIVIVWACVFTFVAILIITVGGLINRINVRREFLNILVYALIIEVVVGFGAATLKYFNKEIGNENNQVTSSSEQPVPTPEEQPDPPQAEQPVPTPEERPDPTPEEQPVPTPEEQPVPTPEERPDPTPEEQPVPTPEEQPVPTPEEQPDPSQAEQPVPTPEERPVPTPEERPDPPLDEQGESEGVQYKCEEDGADKICFTTPSCLMYPPKITCKTLITVYQEGRVTINGLHESRLYIVSGGGIFKLEQANFGDMDWNKNYRYGHVEQKLPKDVPVELKLIFSGENNNITPSSRISFDVQYISTSRTGNRPHRFRNITLGLSDPPPPIWTILEQNVVHD